MQCYGFNTESEETEMKQKFGVGLNKEEAEYVKGLFNYDEMWEYLQNQAIEDDRITRLNGRIEKAIAQAVAEEMI